MSRWDGLPESPPPLSMLGKRGQKAQQKVTEAVVAAQKPPTAEQSRAIIEARQALVGAVIDDPDFNPDTRVAEIEGQLIEHINQIDALFGDLAAWRGAARWRLDPATPYRPITATSNGARARRLRLTDVASAADLINVLRETLGVEAPNAGLDRVPEFSDNPLKRPQRLVA